MPVNLLTRTAAIQPDTFNEEARTVRVVWSTGAAVNRRDAQGAFREVLSLDPGHVRLDHLRGASVLDTHQQRTLASVLGVVQDASVEDGAGWATIRFSTRAEVQPIVADVRDGVIRHVSVGYSVDRWQDTAEGGVRTRTAIAWTPREISFVPLPADPGASVRNHMTETTTAEADTRAEVNTQIRSIATVSGLDAAFADAQIDRGATVEQARAAAFEELVQRGGGTIRTQRVEVGQDHTDPAALVTRMGEALACSLTGQAPSDAARPFMGMGMADSARALLAARGERVSTLSREEVLTRAAAHTLSDFPNLLTGVGNRVLLPAYQAAQTPLRQLARQRNAADFRPVSLLRIGEFGKLKPVNEMGEIKALTTGEAKEGYALETFGGMFALSRKAIINDDLGAFGQWSAMMGRAAAETEADQLVQMVIQASGAGPVMGDGKRLFHTDHGNLATPGPLNVASLSAARLAMRTQKGLDGKSPINVTPKYLLVSADLETLAEQVLAQLTAATVEGQNPFAGKLTLLVEGRLPAGAWYVFADPAASPVLEYAYLSSAQGPQMASRDGWEVLAREFRVVLDFGCGAIDWRGAYRNAGA
ncbi:Phage Head Protease [Roseomonas mucosa]|uniref:prohead protease/major capsid protein fusion protein n=1 Tax=Roseomonas mucosa TaxID=207340 RepID=UPI0021FF41EF|nr:prohead protease/major capsid protein fusion protein [Roseomonas mucosa]QDJ10788.1 Phage Head Protease [Roseomonas mucosa]